MREGYRNEIEKFENDEIFNILFNECKNPKTFQLQQFVLLNYEDIVDYNSTMDQISAISKEIIRLSGERYQLGKFCTEIKDKISNEYPLEVLKEMANESRVFDFKNLSSADKIKYLQTILEK